MTIEIYRYAVLLHFGFGFVMLSNREIIQNESDFQGSQIKDLISGNIPFADRITAGHTLTMFIAFLMVLCWNIIRCIKSRRCQSNKENLSKEKKLLYKLSYKELIGEYMETNNELKSLPRDDYNILKEKLKNKLKILKSIIKKYFQQYEATNLDEINSDELSDQTLHNFFYDHKEELSSRI